MQTFICKRIVAKRYLWKDRFQNAVATLVEAGKYTHALTNTSQSD